MSYQGVYSLTAVNATVGNSTPSTLTLTPVMQEYNAVRVSYLEGSGAFAVITGGIGSAPDPVNTGLGGSVIMKGSHLVMVGKLNVIKAICNAGTDNRIHVEACTYKPGTI
jgi:hypothetical protein